MFIFPFEKSFHVKIIAVGSIAVMRVLLCKSTISLDVLRIATMRLI